MRFTALQIEINELRGKVNEIIDELHAKVYEVVKRNGGEVDMSDEECDNAYTVVYNCYNEAIETQITGIRIKGNSLEIKVRGDDEWFSLRWGEHEYIKALLSIAENIFGYIPIEDDRED